jgi:hypothetical protein
MMALAHFTAVPTAFVRDSTCVVKTLVHACRSHMDDHLKLEKAALNNCTSHSG